MSGKCNKISKQIYKVIQHFTRRTWKKLLVIIVGWQAKRRQGDMGHLQCPENNKISVQIYKVIQHFTGRTTLWHWYILLCKNLVYPFWKCVASSSNGRFNILNPSIAFARVGLQAADHPFLSTPFPCLLVQASSCRHVYSTGPSYQAKQWQQQHNRIMLCFLPPPSSYLPFAKDRIHQTNESIQK